MEKRKRCGCVSALYYWGELETRETDARKGGGGKLGTDELEQHVLHRGAALGSRSRPLLDHSYRHSGSLYAAAPCQGTRSLQGVAFVGYSGQTFSEKEQRGQVAPSAICCAETRETSFRRVGLEERRHAEEGWLLGFCEEACFPPGCDEQQPATPAPNGLFLPMDLVAF